MTGKTKHENSTMEETSEYSGHLNVSIDMKIIIIRLLNSKKQQKEN